MPEFQVKEGKVSYLERAGKVPVMLLHAGAGSSRQWSKVTNLLSPDIGVVAPDFWNMGTTDRWPGPMDLTHDNQASLVLAVANHLNIERFHVVGHSYGGAAGIRFAVKWPERLASMVLIEPVVMTLLKDSTDQHLFEEYDRVASGFVKAAAQGEAALGWERFIDYRNGGGAWERMAPEVKGRFLATTSTVVEGFQSNLMNPTTRSELSRVRTRTLVLCGSKTTLPDRRVSEIVRDHIPGAQYRVIDGAEHMSPLSHPKEVAQYIERHVHGHEGT